MKDKLLITTLIAAVSFPALAQTKPEAPTLSTEQRAAKKTGSQAKFAVMSREEKAARKGHKQMPVKPTAPNSPKTPK